MVLKYLKACVTAIFLLFPLIIFSQKTNIDKPVLEYRNDKLNITYDIGGNKSDNYNVWIEIVNANGEKIKPQSLSGDFGLNIKGGEDKLIVWNISNDNIELEETISVRVLIELLPKHFSKGKLVLQSTVWPGWGQTKLKNGKPYWLIGVVGTACLAGSYIYNKKSIKNYNLYLDANSSDYGNTLYDLSVQQDNTSNILAYSAIGIWVANILWVALMPNNSSKISPQNVSFNLLPSNIGNKNSALSLSFSINL